MTFVSSYQQLFDEREPAWWFVFSGTNFSLRAGITGGYSSPERRRHASPPHVEKAVSRGHERHTCLCAECEADIRFPKE